EDGLHAAVGHPCLVRERARVGADRALGDQGHGQGGGHHRHGDSEPRRSSAAHPVSWAKCGWATPEIVVKSPPMRRWFPYAFTGKTPSGLLTRGAYGSMAPVSGLTAASL